MHNLGLKLEWILEEHGVKVCTHLTGSG